MSDLDKAIRAALHQHSAALYEACDPSLSPWPDDPDGSTLRFSRTIRDLLDWANGLENGLDGPSAVGKAFAEQVRTVIATSLGVSGEDRSEPTPAPRRQWTNSAGERWMDHPRQPDTLVLLSTSSGPTHHVVTQSRAGVETHGGPLSDVVTPAPRVWRKGDPEPEDAPLLEDPNGDRLARRTDGLWGWVRIDGRHVHDVVPSPWHNLAVWRDATPEQAAGYWLSEVVTPEGPA